MEDFCSERHAEGGSVLQVQQRDFGEKNDPASCHLWMGEACKEKRVSLCEGPDRDAQHPHQCLALNKSSIYVCLKVKEVKHI